MNRHRVRSLLTLFVFLSAVRIAAAFQTEEKPGAAQSTAAPSIDEIRKAYTDKRDQDVIVLADRALHEITLKGDPEERASELYFWRGAAQRRLGRHSEALVSLEESKSRGFSSPELQLELALVRRKLGDSAGAERDYQELERVLPSDLERQGRLIERWNLEGKDEPRFKLTISPQVGWDSNIVGLDPNTPLTQGDTTFSSYFAGAYIDARYYLIRNNHQILELDYQLMGRDYPESQRLSWLDNLFTALGRQPLNDWADLEVRASLEEAFMRDDGHFRTQRTLGSGLLLEPLHDLQVRLFGDWSLASYYDPSPPEQDRDGTIVRFGAEFAIDLGRGWTLAPYVTYNTYQAQGSDYDSHGFEEGIVLRPEEFLGLKVTASFIFGQQDYTHLNSLTNFTEKRSDRTYQVTLGIVFKHLEKLIGYAPAIAISYVRHDSNIAEFRYNRWNPQFELGVNVISF